MFRQEMFSRDLALDNQGGRSRSIVTIALLLALTMATFAADRLIPLGIVVWVLYLVPLVLTTQLLPRLTGVALTVGSALLILGLSRLEIGNVL